MSIAQSYQIRSGGGSQWRELINRAKENIRKWPVLEQEWRLRVAAKCWLGAVPKAEKFCPH